MTAPDPYDDASADHGQFEKDTLAQDHDAASVDTADVDDAMGQDLISDLIDADVLTPIPEDRVLVHSLNWEFPKQRSHAKEKKQCYD